MMHLAEGTLQAYLDDELPPRDRAGAAEHLLVCGECRAELDDLRRANSVLSSALTELDVGSPAAGAPLPAQRAPTGRGIPSRPAGRRSSAGASSLARAAVLVLLVAAAASATVPGSPVREWIVDAVRPSAPGPAAPRSPTTVERETPALPPAPVGLAVPGLRDVDVVVDGMEGAAIRLVRSDRSGVAVSAQGGLADPTFRMAAGRIEIVGGAGGELIVEIPRGDVDLRLVVDGRRYAEVSGGTLEILHPGQQDGETVFWP